MISLSVLMIDNVHALNDEYEIVSQEEKYFKTVTFPNFINSSTLSLDNSYTSYTVEVTKEEYDSYKDNKISTYSGESIEEVYKKNTIYLLSNGSYYRYKTVVNWKNFPSVRSYDTIAIGHYASVKLRGTVHFEQEYCETNGNCRTLNTHFPRTFDSGSAATFKLPDGSLKSLTQTLYFDVEKAVTDAKVIKQVAAGTYSHANRDVQLNPALTYRVSVSGIVYNDNYLKYFDRMQPVEATWQGSW